ncbi:HlyD family secretion protein [Luteibacter sp. HA06]
MDIPRKISRSKLRSPLIWLVVAAVIILTIYLVRLPQAAPAVDRGSVLIDEVRRGPLTVDVKANGVLSPVDLRVITAQNSCVVAQIHVYPGAIVHPDTLIAELQSPELAQATQDAMWQLRSAEADYQLQYLDQKAAVESARGAKKEADAKMAAYDRLRDKGLYLDGSIDMLRVRVALEEATSHLSSAEARLRFFERSNGDGNIAPAKAKLEQARSLYELKQAQLAALQVKAGMDGILQQLPIQVGERCTAGSTLAIVAKPDPLKAVLKVDQVQAKDIRVGLLVSVDTFNGKAAGKVIRTDPSIRNGTMTVDVGLSDPLPAGARPDLSVEGTIQVEHIPDCLYVNRPALVQAHANSSLFKLVNDGHEAVRVPVRFGRGSNVSLEVLSGLSVGDQVIVSDTTAWANLDRIRIR